MPIADRIKDRRIELGMTQTQLARESNLTPAAISQFESGARKPSFDALSNLASALKVNTDYLLGNQSDDPRLSKMMQGIMELPDEDRELIFDFYELLRKRNSERKR